jgi:hypothetical protein
MSALFNFQSLLTVLILTICTCSFLRSKLPAYINPKLEGFMGVFGKFAVVGDRLSPYVCIACFLMAGATIFVR